MLNDRGIVAGNVLPTGKFSEFGRELDECGSDDYLRGVEAGIQLRVSNVRSQRGDQKS